jgi:hypothetical protein
LQRQFHLAEVIALRFRAEFFNIIFNTRTLAAPSNVLSCPLFGRSTQMLANNLAGSSNVGFNPLYQMGGSRSIQLALELQY